MYTKCVHAHSAGCKAKQKPTWKLWQMSDLDIKKKQYKFLSLHLKTSNQTKSFFLQVFFAQIQWNKALLKDHYASINGKIAQHLHVNKPN